MSELFQGPNQLCQACQAKLKPYPILKTKTLNKPVYVLFEQTDSLQRLLVRLFYFQDLTPASIFFAYSPCSLKFLQKNPLRLVGLEENNPAIQALFQDLPVRFLNKSFQKKIVRPSRPYLAFSVFPLTQKEMEIILKDFNCQGLCLLTQQKFEDLELSKKT